MFKQSTCPQQKQCPVCVQQPCPDCPDCPVALSGDVSVYDLVIANPNLQGRLLGTGNGVVSVDISSLTDGIVVVNNSSKKIVSMDVVVSGNSRATNVDTWYFTHSIDTTYSSILFSTPDPVTIRPTPVPPGGTFIINMTNGDNTIIKDGGGGVFLLYNFTFDT